MNQNPTSHSETQLLVIGYGNSLRGDDGIGPCVADAIGRLRLRGVRPLQCPLLAPELADPISHAQKVIFVDATVEPGDEIRWRELEPGETSQLMTHAADPRTLLALARDVFGHAPKAWWLTIPVEDIGFHLGLSPLAEQNFDVAVKMIQSFYRPLKKPAPASQLQAGTPA